MMTCIIIVRSFWPMHGALRKKYYRMRHHVCTNHDDFGFRVLSTGTLNGKLVSVFWTSYTYYGNCLKNSPLIVEISDLLIRQSFSHLVVLRILIAVVYVACSLDRPPRSHSRLSPSSSVRNTSILIEFSAKLFHL